MKMESVLVGCVLVGSVLMDRLGWKCRGLLVVLSVYLAHIVTVTNSPSLNLKF
jgi:hypothetical protein